MQNYSKNSLLFATHLLASGTDDATVMRIGGWRDFKTFQVYVRLAGVKEKGATDGLGAVFFQVNKGFFAWGVPLDSYLIISCSLP